MEAQSDLTRRLALDAEQVAAGALVGAGILTTDDTGDLALHPDAAVSLLVPAGGDQA